MLAHKGRKQFFFEKKNQKTFTRLAAVLLVSAQGCMKEAAPLPPAPTPEPHYFLSPPYQINGIWFYPAETYTLDTTGIASVNTDTTIDTLTADGEARDPTLATGAMQTIQLPAIVTVTNLDNGRETKVRVNDLGPASPARVIALSPRAALLLAIPENDAARVHIRIDEGLSKRLVEQLGGNGQKLAIAAAPATPVRAESLPPPGSRQPTGPAQIIGAPPPERAQARVPDRLPEQIFQTYAEPGELWLRAGVFSRYDYARQKAAVLSRLGGDVVRSGVGRQTSYAVRAGPFRTVPEADAALNQALRAGIPDARITVE
jgi:rare lipoprotein A